MKALQLVVLPLALATSGCAYPMYGIRPVSYRARMMMAPAPQPSPVGRWDNVMMLEAGTPIVVLQMDGTRTQGRFHSASPSILRLEAAEAAAQIAATDVVRVDRLPHFGQSARDETARGAAVGLGAVGVLGLLAGQAPPARYWAAGALVGGYAGAQAQMAAVGPGTIYVVSAATSPVRP
jgi:hypothetical protein